MFYNFVIAGIAIQCQSAFPLTVSEFDSGFLSGSDNNPEFFISFVQKEYEEPLSQKCLFEFDDLIITLDQDGHEIRYFLFPETKEIYGCSYFTDKFHIHAEIYTDAASLGTKGIPFWNFFMLDQIINRKKGLILHSSYIVDQGKAILFSAPSGGGKSTQACLWNHYRNSRIINGDRSLLMFKGERWIANGFPFHGSSEFCLNESYSVRAIVVLEKDITNHVENMSIREKFNAIMTEIVCNSWSKSFILDTMVTVEKLITKVPVYKYYCNMEEDAVLVLHDLLESLSSKK